MLITAPTNQVVEPTELVRLVAIALCLGLVLYRTRPPGTRSGGSRRQFTEYIVTIGVIFGVGLIVSVGVSLIWSKVSGVASFAAQMMFLRRPLGQIYRSHSAEIWDVVPAIVARLRQSERREVRSELEDLTLELVETWSALPGRYSLQDHLARLLRYAELDQEVTDAILSDPEASGESDSDVVYRALLDSTADVPGRHSVSLEDLRAAFNSARRLDAGTAVLPGQMRLLHLVEPAS